MDDGDHVRGHGQRAFGWVVSREYPPLTERWQMDADGVYRVTTFSTAAIRG